MQLFKRFGFGGVSKDESDEGLEALEALLVPLLKRFGFGGVSNDESDEGLEALLVSLFKRFGFVGVSKDESDEELEVLSEKLELEVLSEKLELEVLSDEELAVLSDEELEVLSDEELKVLSDEELAVLSEKLELAVLSEKLELEELEVGLEILGSIVQNPLKVKNEIHYWLWVLFLMDNLTKSYDNETSQEALRLLCEWLENVEKQDTFIQGKLQRDLLTIPQGSHIIAQKSEETLSAVDIYQIHSVGKNVLSKSASIVWDVLYGPTLYCSQHTRGQQTTVDPI